MRADLRRKNQQRAACAQMAQRFAQALSIGGEAFRTRTEIDPDRRRGVEVERGERTVRKHPGVRPPAERDRE